MTSVVRTVRTSQPMYAVTVKTNVYVLGVENAPTMMSAVQLIILFCAQVMMGTIFVVNWALTESRLFAAIKLIVALGRESIAAVLIRMYYVIMAQEQSIVALKELLDAASDQILVPPMGFVDHLSPILLN